MGVNDLSQLGKPARLRASGYVLVYRPLEVGHVYRVLHVYCVLFVRSDGAEFLTCKIADRRQWAYVLV